MNILFLTYQGDLAGSTFSIAYLAQELSKRGHNIYVGVREESMLFKLLQESSVEVVPMVFKGRMDISNIRHIVQICRSRNIDIINAQSSLDRYTSIFSVKIFGLKTKVVHTRRQQPKSIGGLQNIFYQWGTDKIVVISEELKKAFIKKGIREKNIRVIHNGLPESRYKQWSADRVGDLKRELGIDEGDLVIGCVSRLKNQQQLIAAARGMERKNITLVFCGIEPKELGYVSMDEDKFKIIFRGKVPKEDILNYFKLFDLNVLASTMDGFGLVLIEAMAMGCPVVATNYGGIKDVVKDNVNGLLFDDGDIGQLKEKIYSILDDPELRNRLIEEGKKSAFEVFTMEKTAEKYEKLFFQLRG